MTYCRSLRIIVVWFCISKNNSTTPWYVYKLDQVLQHNKRTKPDRAFENAFQLADQAEMLRGKVKLRAGGSVATNDEN